MSTSKRRNPSGETSDLGILRFRPRALRRSFILAAATGAFLTALAAPPATAASSAVNAAAGKQVYRGSCVACHGTAGHGAMPGVPDFHKAGGVLSQPDGVLFDRIRNGYRSPGSRLAMPAKGGNPDLSDDDIRNVIAWLREAFGAKSGTAPNPATQDGSGDAGTSMPRGMMGNGRMHRGGMMMGN